MDQQSTQDRTQLVEAVDTLREKLFAALDENAGQDEYVTLERQVKEAAQTLAAFDTAQLLARRYDPEIVSLKEQRERLAREWQYAKQELWGHQDRRVEAVGNGDMYHYDGDKLEREIADAEAALNVFDDTHPEIVSLLNAERDESTERNMWN